MILSKKEILSLVQQFTEKTLPASQWTHEAHLIVGLWMANEYELAEAIERMKQYIISYNESIGTPNTDTSGYHETLTHFWLMISSDFFKERKHSSFEDNCNEFLTSQWAKRSLPLEYYEKEALFSVKARHQFVPFDK